MEIAEIKSRLSLSEVLRHYNLRPDRNKMLSCPFHEDKKPSMQVYEKTGTVYCFSGNCKTHGKSLDVIDFILHKENCSKHEAILKAKEMVGGEVSVKLSRSEVLAKMFSYFCKGLQASKVGKEYLAKRGLDYRKTLVGYNSGQFHHGKRKDEGLIKDCLMAGLLSGNSSGAYRIFGKWCICFSLKNGQGQIVGMYFRSTLDGKKQRHFYLKDRQGLYPNYPNKDTKKLILTESIIDAATLLERSEIKSGYEVLALYGTNGLTEEHRKAIKNLSELEEIIFFLNGDEAGRKAVEKYAPMLKSEYPSLKISNVETPDNEDVNSLLQGHSPEILNHLIESRKEYNYVPNDKPILFSNEIKKEKKEAEGGLDSKNPYNLKYEGNEASYAIKGFKVKQMDSLKITLQIMLQ